MHVCVPARVHSYTDMHTRVCLHMCTCARTHTCVCPACVFTHGCIHVCVPAHVHLCVYIHVCLHTRARVCMHTMHACTYAFTHTYVQCIYVHTCVPARVRMHAGVSLCIYSHTHVPAYVCSCMCEHTCAWCMYTSTHMCIVHSCVRIHTCTTSVRPCVYVCTHVCFHTCARACMCVHVCACSHECRGDRRIKVMSSSLTLVQLFRKQ